MLAGKKKALAISAEIRMLYFYAIIQAHKQNKLELLSSSGLKMNSKINY